MKHAFIAPHTLDNHIIKHVSQKWKKILLTKTIFGSERANTTKLFQENPRCWNTLDIHEYSSSQKLEISSNSKLFFPGGVWLDAMKETRYSTLCF